MAQFARPVSDAENNWTSGDFEDINEVTPSDVDFAFSQDNPTPGTGNNGYFRVNLTGVTNPDTGTHTIRYRTALIDGGVLASDVGTGCDITVFLIEGASTAIANSGLISLDGDLSWTDRSFTLSGPEAAAVGNWGDLDLAYDADGGGGSPGNRRAAGLSWSEMETPDEAVGGLTMIHVMHHRKQMAGN